MGAVANLHTYFLTDYHLLIQAIELIEMNDDAVLIDMEDYYSLTLDAPTTQPFESFARSLGITLNEELISDMSVT